MKKIILLLLFLPILSFATCPTIVNYKIKCMTQGKKTVVVVHDVDTKYNIAAPECKVSDPDLVDSKTGNFRMDRIRIVYCKLTNLNYDIKIRLVPGMNWVVDAGFVKALPRTYHFDASKKIWRRK